MLSFDFHVDKQPFFTKNWEILVSKVKNVHRRQYLRRSGFSEEMATNVQAENTAKARMGRIILYCVATDALAEALFNALLQHEPSLMMELPREKHPRD